MSCERQEFGRRAEDHACGFLKKRGYRIVERNYRTRAAEIDIIARQGGFLVFIEVKARKSLRKGSPREAVDLLKQKKIIFAATYYLKEKNFIDVRVRFDVVAIHEINRGFEIEIIENAFQAR